MSSDLAKKSHSFYWVFSARSLIMHSTSHTIFISYLRSMATSLLGNSIVVGSPFHQMTSSSSINGNVMKTVQLAMPVEGTSQKGIVSVEVRLPQF